MSDAARLNVRQQLEERRARLTEAIARAPGEDEVQRLLGEVDAALERIDAGTYGLCQTCHDPIEEDRLQADPLCCFCIDHLSGEQQRDLERDLELAGKIQRGLRPQPHITAPGWEAFHRMLPAGPVSGDFCDVVWQHRAPGELFVLFGDVSGKGVAAGMVVSHLHAAFRTLEPTENDVAALVERVNRVFRSSSASSAFATLVCARASADGDVDLCNAGHCPPVLLRGGRVSTVAPTGMPVGVFYSSRFASTRLHLEPGDALVLYTDGVTEALDPHGTEYGEDRLLRVVGDAAGDGPEGISERCFADLARHLDGARHGDDVTVMVLQRTDAGLRA